MKEEMINLLESLNANMDGKLVQTDIPSYVNKILKTATIISINNNNQLLGFIAYYDNDYNNKAAFLSMLAIANKSKNLGYGENLLQMSSNNLLKKGFIKYTLAVHNKNVAAIKLYEKNGFVRDNNAQDIIYMEKKLV